MDTEEQVILQAEGYNRDEPEVPKVLGRIQASGEDFHITVQLEGVPHPVEIKHVDGASYIREGLSGWQDFGSSSPYVAPKCVEPDQLRRDWEGNGGQGRYDTLFGSTAEVRPRL